MAEPGRADVGDASGVVRASPRASLRSHAPEADSAAVGLLADVSPPRAWARSGRERAGAGLERAAGAVGPLQRELAPRLRAAVAASAQLQARDALKRVGLSAAMTTALVDRGIPDPVAQLAAELGVLAFKRGYAEWSEDDQRDEGGLAACLLAALADLRKAVEALG